MMRPSTTTSDRNHGPPSPFSERQKQPIILAGGLSDDFGTSDSRCGPGASKVIGKPTCKYYRLFLAFRKGGMAGRKGGKSFCPNTWSARLLSVIASFL